MERFESVMDNVSELEVKCYEDPVECTYNLEIWAKSGEEVYLYKFIGPGVRNANIPMFDDRLDLAKENEKLKKELSDWKKEAADCLRLRDKAQKEAYKLKEAYKKLQQEKSKIPMVDDCLKLTNEIEKLTFENAMLKKGNDKIKKENEKLRQENKELISKNEIELLSKYHDPCDHCVCADVDASNEPCFSCDHFNKFEKSSFDQPKSDDAKRDEEVDPSTRADILDQAKKCVCGQREQDYGTPESNFQLIADLWNGYLGLCENGDGVPIFSIKNITPTDVSMMMALMKIARIRNGGGSGDSFVDLAGYAACGGEIWDERHKDK